VTQLKWIALLGVATAITTGPGIPAHQALNVSPANGEPKELLAMVDEQREQPKSQKANQPRLDLYGDPLPEGAIAWMGSSRLRIGNSDFALTPDGKVIVTVAPEGMVREFDAQTGRLLTRRQLTDRSNVDPMGQWSAHLSADGKTVAIHERAGSGGRVTVWDIPSGRMIFRREPKEGKSIGRFALSSDGKQLAVDERLDGPKESQTLRVYDLKSGKMKELGSLEFNLYTIRFSGDGNRVFVFQISSSDRSSTYACFDVVAGKQLWKLPTAGQEFAITSDGKMLLSASSDQSGLQVIETDLVSGKATESFKTCPGAHPNIRVVIAPDNRTVVMNHFDGIRIWDLSTGEEVRRITPPKTNLHGYGPQIGAFSADSRTMVTNTGHLQRWDLKTGKPLFESPPDDAMDAPIERLAFTANGKELFVSSWALASASYEVATGKRIGNTRQKLGDQLVSTWAGLRVLQCASSETPYEITLIDPVAEKLLRTVQWAAPSEVRINGLRSFTLAKDGKTLLVAHGDEPGPESAQKSYLTAWNVASNRRIARITVPGNFYYAQPPFSPDGRWAVLAGKVYHVGTGTELFTPTGEPGESLQPNDRWWTGPVWFSEDGRLLAGKLRRKDRPESPDLLAVWELASGKILARFPRARFIAQVAFSPDGRTLAFVDGRGIHLHDLLNGKELSMYSAPDVTCEITNRGCGTQTLVFSPDGSMLATGHRDGGVLLWKVPQASDDRPHQLSEAERNALWTDLGSDSAVKAKTAIERLAHSRSVAIALITAKLNPLAATADPAITTLVQELDSDQFATRENAMHKLRAHGAKAELALRRALDGSTSVEMRHRIEVLLEPIPVPLLELPVSGDSLRAVRAVEVLEHIGSPQAQKVLKTLSHGAPDARLTQEAKASLERLTHRSTVSP
jgi:WD40 repeat protein